LNKPRDTSETPGSPNARRTLLTAGLAGAAATVGAGGALWLKRSRADQPSRELPALLDGKGRPLNILLVMSDQERFDLPRGLPLPGHDRLRERGTEFTQWHVNTTPCSPSRSNLYFGQHTQKTGMVVNLGVYPEPQASPAMPSLGHYFRANGYLTAYKGKWHLSDIRAHFELTYGRYPNSRDALEPFGFSDYNFDGDPHGSTWTGYKYDAQIAAESARWLHTRGKASARPWLLAVNFVNPHDVVYVATDVAQMASRRHRDYLAPLAGPPVDPLYARQWDFALPANHRDDLSRKPWAHRNYQEFCDMAFGRLSDGEEAWRAYQNYYFNCIRDVDRHLLTVLDALEASGQAGRTIVVYTADHGEMAGAHGLRQKGPFIYQENTRVPFIVRHPDLREGRRTAALGCAVDLIPSLLEMAGCGAKAIETAYPQLAGTSVAAAVQNPDARTARDERGILFNYNTTHYIDAAFATELLDRDVQADRLMPLRAVLAGMRPLPHRHHPTLFRGIHTGRHKFARYFKPAEHHRPADWETLTRHNALELYDLQTDPGELQNLAHAPEWVKSTVLELNARLNALVAQEVGPDLGDELTGPWFMKRL
jgi:arylsulfatase